MMAAIYEWLQDRLGTILPEDPNHFGNAFKDGYEISKILRSYQIISDDHLILIEKTDSITGAFKNFTNFISHWLKLINIELNQVEILGIIQGRTSDIHELLCRMYLELNGDSHITFLCNQRKNEENLTTNKRFKVEPVEETEISKRTLNALFDMPFIKAHDIIHWQQDRMKVLQERCRESRREYKAHLKIKSRTDDSYLLNSESKTKLSENVVLEECDECETSSYKSLKDEQNKAKNLKMMKPDLSKFIDIAEQIKNKKNNETKQQIESLHSQNELSTEITNKINKHLSNIFDNGVVDMVFRQTHYEKQMVTKLLEINAQQDVIIENKRLQDLNIQRENEKQFLQDAIMRDKSIQEKKLTFYLEQERLNELHRKIYGQKLKLKQKRTLDDCKNILDDVLKLVYREIDYKEHFQEVPTRRIRDAWKILFVTEQPLWDIVEPVEKIVKFDNVSEEIELEIQRQEEIDKEEFHNYINYQYPWILSEEMLTDSDILERGLNVLGYIVHRLLFSKYPLPTPKEILNFPDIKYTVCVNGLLESIDCCVPTLQKLLDKNRIKVIQIEDLIEFCMQSFNKETKKNFDDAVLIEETEEALKSENKKLKVKKKESKTTIKEKNSKVKQKKSQLIEKSKKLLEPNEIEEEQIIKFETKTTQTLEPEDEDIPLSVASELGKIAMEQMSLGHPLTDYLLVSMFVEYLKSLKDISGWVLINFPLFYSQASLLEEKLTGNLITKIPDCRSELNELIAAELRYNAYVRDELAPSRVSHILPNPFKTDNSNDFQTCLTAYIKIKKKENQDNDEFNNQENTDDPLEMLYSSQGCYYNLYYDNFDFNTIKYLARLIIGDFSIPAKSSIELFGNNVQLIENEYLFGTSDKPKIVKTEGTTKKKSSKPKKKETNKSKPEKEKSSKKTDSSKKEKSKKQKSQKTLSRTYDEKGVQIPEESEEELELVEEVIPRVGEPNYEYLKLMIPEAIESVLTEFWEVCENNYIEDMKQLFFIKRTTLNSVVPYIRNVKDLILLFLKRPDEKQNILLQFQKLYNEFDADFRRDDELKAELHHRISQLRQKLVNISETEMFESEKLRKQLIDENWIFKQIGQLSNIFVSIFQLELDRSADSLQLLNDYYSVIINKMHTNNVILKNQLKKIDIIKLLDDLNVVSEFNEILTKTEWNENKQIIFHYKINDVFETAIKFVEEINNQSLHVVNEKKNLFNPSRKSKKDKKVTKNDKKSKSSEKCFSFTDLDETVKENQEKIFDEWLTGVAGEISRVKLRLNLIKQHATSSVTNVFETCLKGFHKCLLFIEERYRNELNSIENACKVLQRAVELETPIQEEMVFIDDEFFINPENLLYDDPVIIPPKRKEIECKKNFSMEQLEYIFFIMSDLAPNNYISQKTFLYLLQDFCVYETSFGPIVPKLWQKLTKANLNELISNFFDNNEYVYWKDFILLNLTIDFPTEEELLHLRIEFRKHDPDSTELIMDYQFLHTQLWFENKINDGIRLKLMKNLLLKMYLTSSDKFNYTSFLLDFCKDFNPILGFAKALEVCLGKLVCWNENEGKQYVDNLLKKRKENEEKIIEHEKNINNVKNILEDVVEESVDTNIIIEEINNTQTVSINKEINKILFENIFTNVTIGKESDKTLKSIHYLSLEVILIVLTSTLTWHCKVQNIDDQSLREIVEEIYEECKNGDFNGAVLAHEFLNHARFSEILYRTTKFTLFNVVELVEKLTSP